MISKFIVQCPLTNPLCPLFRLDQHLEGRAVLCTSIHPADSVVGFSAAGSGCGFCRIRSEGDTDIWGLQDY